MPLGGGGCSICTTGILGKHLTFLEPACIGIPPTYRIINASYHMYDMYECRHQHAWSLELPYLQIPIF